MTTQYFISRSSIQWILHQAIVADERAIFCGLIGTRVLESRTIEKVAMVKESRDIAHTLSVWEELGIECLGFFHLEGAALQEGLTSAMPVQYIKLGICLAEKGRLDTKSYLCDANTERCVKIDLDLIEDGQSESVA